MAARVIQLDASKWRRPSDVDQALKVALGSPEGHGNGPDAWIEFMLNGRTNAASPPYRIEVAGTSQLNEATLYYLLFIGVSVAYARLRKLVERGVDTDVSISVYP